MIFVGQILSIPELISTGDLTLILVVILTIYCAHQSDWKIKKILAYKFWTPISKMGLSIYLVTGYFIYTQHQRLVQPLDIENVFHFVSKLQSSMLTSSQLQVLD